MSDLKQQDAPIQIDPTLRSEEALKCILFLLTALSRSFMSPTVLELALHDASVMAAEANIQNRDEIIRKLTEICFGLRRQNGAIAALDKSGFW